MISSIRKDTYLAMYRLLNSVSPLATDCGELCGSICCLPVGEDLGIYLLPGEEKVFTQREDWISWDSESVDGYEFPDSWRGKVYFIRCKTAPICPREMRPLQCRFYPLEPHLTEDDRLLLIWSTANTPYTCPLIREEMTLEPSFIKASYTVWKRLIEEPLIYDLVKLDSDQRGLFLPVYPDL
ncbi:MAG: hypothetical protein ACOYJU_04825 [Anaerovoracaceae bacterium]|jgi:hypothetical protein